jgi:hypothetical protein
MDTFTYVNFLRLSGDELDVDFRRACKEHGAGDDTEIDVIPVRSIAGHAAYIASVVEPKKP